MEAKNRVKKFTKMKILSLSILLCAGLIGCSAGSPARQTEGVLNKLSAARQGGASAQYLVGKFYESGQNLPANDQRAADWLKRGAESGFPHAKYELALLHMDGRGVPRDYGEANKLMESAAQQGYLLAQRDYVMFLYQDAPFELRDPVRAYAWLAVVQRNNPVQYQRFAAINDQLAGELSESDLAEAETLRAVYPDLYRPWNRR